MSRTLRRASANASAAGEGREHRDVQAGDADEMRDAGAVEHGPLRFGNRALVADRERHDHAGVRRAAQRAQRCASRTRFARALHVVAERPGERVDALVVARATHITGRAQVVLQQPRFEVEAAGIDVAVRALAAAP